MCIHQCYIPQAVKLCSLTPEVESQTDATTLPASTHFVWHSVVKCLAMLLVEEVAATAPRHVVWVACVHLLRHQFAPFGNPVSMPPSCTAEAAPGAATCLRHCRGVEERRAHCRGVEER